VRKPLRNLWILGGQAVHNTRYWGEQIKNIPASLIRRRFVPALTGTLTTTAGIACQFLNAD
jgi:hypothetical protein